MPVNALHNAYAGLTAADRITAESSRNIAATGRPLSEKDSRTPGGGSASIAENMVNIIHALHQFKANADSIRTADTLLGEIVDMRK